MLSPINFLIPYEQQILSDWNIILQSHGYLIFIMGIPIQVRQQIYTESDPSCTCLTECIGYIPWNMQMVWFALFPFWLFYKLLVDLHRSPDIKVHGANMGPTWVLSAPDGPHVGHMNLAIRVNYLSKFASQLVQSYFPMIARVSIK